MERIPLLQRHHRLAAAVALGVLAAAAPAWGQGRPPQAPGVCLGLPAQLGMAVAMLILTSVIHTLVTVIQAECTHRQRLDAWCAPRSRRRLLMILAMALLTALALWVEILLWALLYQGLGLFSGLEGSLYFSGITFTTVGYGDIVRVRFEDYIFSIFFVAYPLHLRRSILEYHAIYVHWVWQQWLVRFEEYIFGICFPG